MFSGCGCNNNSITWIIVAIIVLYFLSGNECGLCSGNVGGQGGCSGNCGCGCR